MAAGLDASVQSALFLVHWKSGPMMRLVFSLFCLGVWLPAWASPPSLETLIVEGASEPPKDPLNPEADANQLLSERPLRLEGLAELVNELPGVSMLSLGGLGSTQLVSIRGADYEHTRVLVDDILIAAPDRGAIDLSLIPLSGFSEVQLFRSSAPIRYGLGAIGGVIRLVPSSAGSRSVKGEARIGNFGVTELGFEAQGWTGNFSGLLAAKVQHAENDYPYYDDNATYFIAEDDRIRRRVNAESSQFNTTGLLSWESLGHKLSWLSLVVEQARGLPGPSTGISTLSQEGRSRIFNSLGYRFRGEAQNLPLDAFLSLGYGWDQSRVQDPDARIGLGKKSRKDNYHSLELRGGAFYEPVSWLALGATLGLRRDLIQPMNRYKAFQNPDSRRDQLTIAGEITLHSPFERLPASLQGSIASELHDARIHGETHGSSGDQRLQTHATLYRARLDVGPFYGLSLDASAATGLRLPTTLELFGNGSTLVGYPKLKPEEGMVLDLSLNYRGELGPISAHARVSAYRQRIQNLIFARRTSQFAITFRNEQAANHYGFEASLDLRVGDWLRSQSAIDLAKNQIVYRGYRLNQPMKSPFHLFQRLELLLGLQQKELSQVSVFAELSYAARSFADLRSELRQPPQMSINLGASLRLSPALTLSFAVRNLLDEQNRDILSYPKPGRFLELNLTWKEIL